MFVEQLKTLKSSLLGIRKAPLSSSDNRAIQMGDTGPIPKHELIKFSKRAIIDNSTAHRIRNDRNSLNLK